MKTIPFTVDAYKDGMKVIYRNQEEPIEWHIIHRSKPHAIAVSVDKMGSVHTHFQYDYTLSTIESVPLQGYDLMLVVPDPVKDFDGNFSKLPIGTEVWHVINGKGHIVFRKDWLSYYYPVTVKFDKLKAQFDGDIINFTETGFENIRNLMPSLYIKEPIISFKD